MAARRSSARQPLWPAGKHDLIFAGGNQWLDAHFPKLDSASAGQAAQVPARRPLIHSDSLAPLRKHSVSAFLKKACRGA
jgi:hypothetical protein